MPLLNWRICQINNVVGGPSNKYFAIFTFIRLIYWLNSFSHTYIPVSNYSLVFLLYYPILIFDENFVLGAIEFKFNNIIPPISTYTHRKNSGPFLINRITLKSIVVAVVLISKTIFVLGLAHFEQVKYKNEIITLSVSWSVLFQVKP